MNSQSVETQGTVELSHRDGCMSVPEQRCAKPASESPDALGVGTVAARLDRVHADELSLLNVLIVLGRQKKTIAGVTVAAILVAFVVSMLLPNRYTASAKILPPQRSQSFAASLIGQMALPGSVTAMAQTGLGLKNPNDLYVGMLKSRTVTDVLVGRFDLLSVYHKKKVSDARDALGRVTDIQLGKEGFIIVSVEDTNPKRAADMANAYVDELRKLTQVLAVTEAAQRRLFFEQQLERAKDNLASAEEELKRTQQATGIIQLEGQAKAIIESVVTLRAQVAAKEVQVRALRSFGTEQNLDVILAEQQLGAMRAQLASLEKQSGGGADIQVATGKIPEAGLQYMRRMRDVKYYETIFELLAKQYEAAKLDEAKDAAVVQVLDPAVEPDRKSSPKRSMIILGISMLGFIVAVCGVLLREVLQRMRMDPETRLQLDMLGQTMLQGVPLMRSLAGK